MPMETSAKIKALIIDDESDICYLLSSILKHRNVQARFACSLSEADQILKHDSAPPLIFLDNHLPDGTGVGYISKLKKKYPATKIVMMTAHDTLPDREKARLAGVDYFIGKPFTREVIFKTIDSLTG